MEYCLQEPFPTFNDVEFASLFRIETEQMPSKAYIQSIITEISDLAVVRNEIFTKIVRVGLTLDPFLTYQAVNYMDRYLATQSISEWKPCIYKLISIACISLALKMRNVRSFLFSDLMVDGGFKFDSPTIKRMEMLILGGLNWGMRSVTPFSFTNYFMDFLEIYDMQLITSLRIKAEEIYAKAQNENINLMQFNPSIISACALLCVIREQLPDQFPSFTESIYSCPYVDKGNLQDCYDLMRDIPIELSVTGECSGSYYESSECEITNI